MAQLSGTGSDEEKETDEKLSEDTKDTGDAKDIEDTEDTGDTGDTDNMEGLIALKTTLVSDVPGRRHCAPSFVRHSPSQ